MIKSAIYLIGICLMLTGCEQSSLPGQQIRLANQGLLSADLASSGKQAIVSSLGQGTVVWDLEQGKERWRWRQSDNQDNFVIITRFSADNSHAVTATLDTFAIWRLQDGRSQGYYSLPESSLRDAALSADGRLVLIGREDGKAELVDTRTGRRLQFLGHTEQVNTVDLSANGRYALTGGNDYSAYLWDTRSGQVIWRFNHGGRVIMARLEPSGRYAFTDPNGVAYDLSVKPGQTNPVYTPGLPACAPGVTRSDGFQCFDFGRDAFNYAPFNLLMTPSKRMGAFDPPDTTVEVLHIRVRHGFHLYLTPTVFGCITKLRQK